MYFPSPLPTTRLSISTSAVPTGPSPQSRPKPGNRSTSGSASKLAAKRGDAARSGLGGVLEEDGEEVIAIVRAPLSMYDDSNVSEDWDESGAVWASLGREELCLWRIRVSFGADP